MEEREALPSVEKMRQVETAWLFDVDGVITSPGTSLEFNRAVLGHLAKRLGGGRASSVRDWPRN